MSAPLLIDLSHTSHTRARTGIQRVTRSLRAALGDRAIGITYDPHREAWRELDAQEHATLADPDAATKRSAHWPLGGATARSRAAMASASFCYPAGKLRPVGARSFSPRVAHALPELFGASRAPRVALFHDAIALKLPELTPSATVARFPAYLVELLRFDGVAAVSEDSRASLVDYWRWLGVANTPRVRAIPLGVPPQSRPSIGEFHPAGRIPTVLTIGSIEGRKNHLALLDACERLWERGERFSLHLIGMAHAKTGGPALARIHALMSAGRPIRYDGPVNDSEVDAAYADATFTVYPSLMEGFGLPVIESLSHGKPCICSNRGALGESARDGGCLPVDQMDADAIGAAITRLLHRPTEVARLSAEIRSRRFKTWADYADEILLWMEELRNERQRIGSI